MPAAQALAVDGGRVSLQDSWKSFLEHELAPPMAQQHTPALVLDGVGAGAWRIRTEMMSWGVSCGQL